VKTITLRIESAGLPATERACSTVPLVFGRAVDADVVCNDASMSRRHARIVPEGNAFYVEDLGGRNGTFINGERLRERARIADGDVIQMGATVVQVFDAKPAAAPAQPAKALGVGLLGSSIFRSVADISPEGTASGAVAEAAPARIAARLNALNQFHRSMAGAISLDALLALLLERLFAVLRPEEGVILLRQPDGSLKTVASRRLPGSSGELTVSQKLAHEVVDKNTAALVTDVAVDERVSDSNSLLGAGIRSILAAPFTDGEGCLGMVAIYSRTSVRRFGEEDLELLVSLAAAAALRIRNVELAEAAAARRVQDRELALAHDIQMAMLPRRMPERPDVDLSAALIPARAVGGDLYDFIVVDDHLWFIVADAAGKGVSAALFMAVTRTLFRAVAHAAPSVSSVVERMNAELARDNEQQFFVTALVGRLSLHSGELAYCNAGHPAMLRIKPGGRPESLDGAAPAIALGVMEEAAYPEAHAVLAAGDVVLAFTDGVTEAINARGELFADARLAAALERGAKDTPAAIVSGIVNAVNAFAAGTAQEDDITVLALRYAGRF
jgi:serine phosphatase RsbU (regulator of sigma subunit)